MTADFLFGKTHTAPASIDAGGQATAERHSPPSECSARAALLQRMDRMEELRRELMGNTAAADRSHRELLNAVLDERARAQRSFSGTSQWHRAKTYAKVLLANSCRQ
jgi:hypothetical protein